MLLIKMFTLESNNIVHYTVHVGLSYVLTAVSFQLTLALCQAPLIKGEAQAFLSAEYRLTIPDSMQSHCCISKHCKITSTCATIMLIYTRLLT